MRRLAAVLFVACCALLVGIGAAHAASSATPCQTAEVRVYDEVVFGHFSTLAAAKQLRARAVPFGFNGIKIENEGCGDFEVEIDGADRPADRGSVANEAAKAGFQITFEQTAAPMQYRAGEVVGIFAHKKTVAAANALMLKLAALNFRYIDLVRQGTSWLVVMPQVPTKDALSIAHEVASAGYQIQFRAGNK